MRKFILLFLTTLLSYAQEVPTSGFLMPRKTTAERLAFPANTAQGIHVYDTDTQSTWYYDGTQWLAVAPSVINNLNSISTVDALSANEGRILNNLIQALDVLPETQRNIAYLQASHSVDHVFAVADTPEPIPFDTNDEDLGITHSTTVNNSEITVRTSAIYTIIAQPQVLSGTNGGTFRMWLQRDQGAGFVDVPNSNVEIILANNGEDVLPLASVGYLAKDDKIRLMGVVNNTAVILDAISPVGEPAVPAVILAMYANSTGVNIQKEVLDIVDASIAPPTTNVNDIYVLTNIGAIDPSWGSVANLEENDVVVYTGTDWVVSLDVSTQFTKGEYQVYNSADGNIYYYNDVSWATVSTDTPTAIVDADGDTKIEVEQAADEDIIRFTTAGTEVLKIDGSRITPTNSNFSVFIGDNTGPDVISTSNNNIFIGRNVGSSITTGNGNVGIGTNAFVNNDIGINNVAIGINSLQSNQNGTGLVAAGVRALQSNTTGIQNVALGKDALGANTTGAYNIGIGPDAGRYIADGSTPRETGANNIYIGKDTKASVDGTSNEIVIGTNVFGKGDNTITLGNGASTELYTAADIISKRFHTIWKSSVNIYNTDDIVIYNGALYKNLTGSNTAVAPDADATNWKEIGVETTAVPLWESQTNGGSYLANDIINHNGILYRNRTNINTDITPDLDILNWETIDTTVADGTTTNNTLRWNGTDWIESNALTNDGTNVSIAGNLNTDTFSTAWVNNTNGGVYIINDIVLYDGDFYKNLTGSNLDTTPDLDTTNWETVDTTITDGTTTDNTLRWDGTDWVESNALTNDGVDIAATGDLKTDTFSTEWVNLTNGGAYAINDIVLYNGGIYKNLTGSNSDVTPNTNATDWETIALGSSYEYLIARSDQTSFNANVDQLFPFAVIVESDGSSITPPATLQNGRYNLAPNGTYRLTADVGVISGSGNAHWRFYNHTDALYISTSSTASQNGNDTTDSSGATCHAIVTTGATPVLVSVRKANGTASTLHYATGSRAIARLFIEKIR